IMDGPELKVKYVHEVLEKALSMAEFDPVAGAMAVIVSIMKTIITKGPNYLTMNDDLENVTTRIAALQSQDSSIMDIGLRDVIYESCNAFKITMDFVRTYVCTVEELNFTNSPIVDSHLQPANNEPRDEIPCQLREPKMEEQIFDYTESANYLTTPLVDVGLAPDTSIKEEVDETN
ncbi:hypothetical protein PFISCL1PPCAC_27870, partial [Pristionchus fissidentatus]